MNSETTVTTADTNYVNVPFLSSKALPLMKWDDKCDILKTLDKNAAAEERAPTGWAGGEDEGADAGAELGVPLFWQECKNEDLCEAWISNYGITEVVDLSPGSGRLACTCLRLGLKYMGLCLNGTHVSWMSNIVDRKALSLAATEGHALWNESLAELIKAHFKDVVGDGEDEHAGNAGDHEEQEEDDDLDDGAMPLEDDS